MDVKSDKIKIMIIITCFKAHLIIVFHDFIKGNSKMYYSL